MTKNTHENIHESFGAFSNEAPSALGGATGPGW